PGGSVREVADLHEVVAGRHAAGRRVAELLRRGARVRADQRRCARAEEEIEDDVVVLEGGRRKTGQCPDAGAGGEWALADVTRRVGARNLAVERDRLHRVGVLDAGGREVVGQARAREGGPGGG